jgi:1-phosphofructokinase/tagatose 6-phosphate kinase
VNVARALKLLGRPVIATGMVGGATGDAILERLGHEGILSDFTRIAGESRTNLAVIDPTSSVQTELNERGPTVSEEEADQFVEKLLYLAQGATICVLAGSAPPGLDGDMYARLVSELGRAGVTCVLDTDGELMRSALKVEPAVVAPNVGEAEEAVGHEFNDPDDLAMGLSGLIEMGAGEAIITREAGCAAIAGDGSARRQYEVSIDTLEPLSTVGSGDCFLAGYVAARYEGGSPRECLAYGVACGAESTQHLGAGTLDVREAERLLGRVEVRELDVAGVSLG